MIICMVYATNGSTVPPSFHIQLGEHSYILIYYFFCVDKKFENISLNCLHTQKNENISEHFRTQVKELSELV